MIKINRSCSSKQQAVHKEWVMNRLGIEANKRLLQLGCNQLNSGSSFQANLEEVWKGIDQYLYLSHPKDLQ